MTRDSELFNHEAAAALLRQLDCPIYIAAGNHDMRHRRPAGISYIDVERLDRREFAAFYADRGLPGGRTWYSVGLPCDVELLVLDSAISGADIYAGLQPEEVADHGCLPAEQLQWLADRLAEIRSRRHRPLVVMHHSLHEMSPAERAGHLLEPTFRFWRLRNAVETTALLARYEVGLVLSGHLHLQGVNSIDGVCNLVTSACVGYPHAWRVLHLSQESMYAETRLLDAIPSLEALQETSYKLQGEGMAALIEEKIGAIEALAELAEPLAQLVDQSGWWQRLCDGTLRGFRMNVPELSGISEQQAGYIHFLAAMLSEFGTWAEERPDPAQIEIGFSSRSG
jgi:hypothetical protein